MGRCKEEKKAAWRRVAKLACAFSTLFFHHVVENPDSTWKPTCSSRCSKWIVFTAPPQQARLGLQLYRFMNPKTKNRSREKKASAKFLQPERLDGDKLKRLYSSMLRCRLFVERLGALERQGQLGPGWLPEAGNEAITAGMLVDLHAEDFIAPGPFSATARLIRSQSPKWALADVRGLKIAQRSKKAPPALSSTLPSNFSVASQINFVLGAASACQARKKDQVAVTFCDEASLPFDEWRDAVLFSQQHRLAVIHVVRTTGRDKGDRVAGGSHAFTSELDDLRSRLPMFLVDGDDALAVYRVGQEAVRRARQGRGPAVIECLTNARPTTALMDVSAKGAQSFVPHPSPISGESAGQQVHDPIIRLENYLQQKGFWSEKWKRGLIARFTRDLDRAVASAERSFVSRPSPATGESVNEPKKPVAAGF